MPLRRWHADRWLAPTLGLPAVGAALILLLNFLVREAWPVLGGAGCHPSQFKDWSKSRHSRAAMAASQAATRALTLTPAGKSIAASSKTPLEASWMERNNNS